MIEEALRCRPLAAAMTDPEVTERLTALAGTSVGLMPRPRRGGLSQDSVDPEKSTVGGVARGGGIRPWLDPPLLLRSYRLVKSSSRRLVNGSAFSARSRARCAKLL